MSMLTFIQSTLYASGIVLFVGLGRLGQRLLRKDARPVNEYVLIGNTSTSYEDTVGCNLPFQSLDSESKQDGVWKLDTEEQGIVSDGKKFWVVDK